MLRTTPLLPPPFKTNNPQKRYLQELGVEAELVQLDMKAKDHKAPAFVQKFPFGKLPALSDGEFDLFESGALLLYLADKYADKSGIDTPQKRATAAQWVLFSNSTLANAIFVEQFRCGCRSCLCYCFASHVAVCRPKLSMYQFVLRALAKAKALAKPTHTQNNKTTLSSPPK
jgi:hypothetical protein